MRSPGEVAPNITSRTRRVGGDVSRREADHEAVAARGEPAPEVARKVLVAGDHEERRRRGGDALPAHLLAAGRAGRRALDCRELTRPEAIEARRVARQVAALAVGEHRPI